MKRILQILFWSVIPAAFIGPGTVTTCASAGAGFGYALPLTTRQSAALAPLGHQAMPFWLLFDPEGQLVLSLSTPTTVQEHLRTIDLLTKVTDARQET